MDATDQKDTVEVPQENDELPQAVQLVMPKEALDEMAEAERLYRETVEKMNR